MTENKDAENSFIENRALVPTCLNSVSDPFLLVLLASRRAQELAYGAQAVVNPTGHKDSVVALQEIALGKIDLDALRETLVESFQNNRVLSVVIAVCTLSLSI
ncbi:DNA-directed RNA polymerase subunit omega [Holospora curviuscula]|uniref:DNA-directed RNA polymerase subunit omega n=1 Tax=Holospora curviuscula TaxID=1082868 RepID=A0A2S5RAG3_9PROT|nr:DNA-directed RNA polymerase subunit omega [Holospora curviuscula]PPE04182.1 DNA-directed RNA polymerase subunit omega [Holospora curviuscula]